MSRLFLDTSAFSAFQRGHSKIHFRIKEATVIVVSPIVLGELRSGFLKGGHRQQNRERLEQFLGSPRVEVMPIDEVIAERYAVILEFLRGQGTPIPTNDIWIAAGAMACGAPLLTTDHHFRYVKQIVAEIYVSEDR